MAKLMLIGDVAEVEILSPGNPGNENGELVIAVCRKHRSRGLTDVAMFSCTWTEDYDTLDDATEYAADHADHGRN